MAKGTRYVVVRAPGHPIARADGLASAHRVVVFDAVGPGPHPCHWCRRTVTWDSAIPADDALVVDHLDDDPANNDLSNLVVSCASCNSHRTLRQQYQAAIVTDEVAALVEEFRQRSERIAAAQRAIAVESAARREVVTLLTEKAGNRSACAAALGISRTLLYRILGSTGAEPSTLADRLDG